MGKNTVFNNSVQGCLFTLNWKQDANNEAAFQQKHCGITLVNNHWKERNRSRSSSFSAAEEENKYEEVQQHRCPAGLEHKTPSITGSLGNRCQIVLRYTATPFFHFFLYYLQGKGSGLWEEQRFCSFLCIVSQSRIIFLQLFFIVLMNISDYQWLTETVP